MSSDVSVGASTFRLESDDDKSADEHSTDAAPSNPKDKEKAALADGLYAVLIAKGKSLVAPTSRMIGAI